jgi:hypothetical protein
MSKNKNSIIAILFAVSTLLHVTSAATSAFLLKPFKEFKLEAVPGLTCCEFGQIQLTFGIACGVKCCELMKCQVILKSD